MNQKMRLRDAHSPNGIFFLGLTMLLLLMVIQLPLRDGAAFFSLLHLDQSDTYMDFFNSIYDGITENPYTERGVIYPPLTYLYYRMCGYLLPMNQTAQQWKSGQPGMLLALVMTALSLLLVYKGLMPEGKQDDKKAKRIVLVCLLGTVPFWYAVERGNLILLTLAALGYFVNHYQSETAWKRELSLICLAIAICFKIYPVCFWLLLLKDRQFKAALRCVLYSVALFFLPFLFFGGMETVLVMVQNITKTTDYMGNLGYGYKINLDNTLGFLAEAFHVPMANAAVVKLLFLAITAGVLIATGKSWQRYMALSAIMIIFPGFSYTYTLIFAAIPLVIYLLEPQKTTTRNLLFSLFFIGMFAPFPAEGYGLFDAAPVYHYPLNLTTVISSLSILGMLVLMAVDVILCRVSEHKARNGKQLSCSEKKEWIRFLVIALVLFVALCAAYLYCDHLYKMSIL